MLQNKAGERVSKTADYPCNLSPESGCMRAEWNEATEAYYANHDMWISQDGDNWHWPNGEDVTGEKFDATTILLCGGPRNGVRVG